MEWISVKDRLPEEHGWYWTRRKTYTSYDAFKEGQYQVVDELLYYQGSVGEVEYWHQSFPEQRKTFEDARKFQEQI